jgi:hypothetical protein
MKKKVAKFINSLGGQSSYSGKRRTMFIHKNTNDIESKVIQEFGYGILFRLETNLF